MMTPRMTADNFMHRLMLIALCMTVAGCVTINIYFPAAAAEKAADRIIDEVWQLKNGASAPAKPPETAPGEAK